MLLMIHKLVKHALLASVLGTTMNGVVGIYCWVGIFVCLNVRWYEVVATSVLGREIIAAHHTVESCLLLVAWCWIPACE